MEKGTGNREKRNLQLAKNNQAANQSRIFAMSKEQGALGYLQLAKNKNNQTVNKEPEARNYGNPGNIVPCQTKPRSGDILIVANTTPLNTF